MEQTDRAFDEQLAALLKGRPGMTKGRIAEAMGMENDDAFRAQLDTACGKDVAHKMMDKYYPGAFKNY